MNVEMKKKEKEEEGSRLLMLVTLSARDALFVLFAQIENEPPFCGIV